jgi:hypothetical protein
MLAIRDIPGKLLRVDGRGDVPRGDAHHGIASVRSPRGGQVLRVIFSAALGWDHVSVAVMGQRRCPTWEEMCVVKGLFWPPETAVMQLHPPASTYVNVHQYCLHLWAPNGATAAIPLPPSIMVG